ncbi:MAG: carbohydrate kinase family protein, partial [Chloroflexota bacterium]
GNTVRFASMIGDDDAALTVRETLVRDNLPTEHVLFALDETPQSVIMYDTDGKRAIFTDLKTIQDATYPEATMRELLTDVDMAVLTNINFTRPYLRLAIELGIPIATDVHAIGSLDDAYNADYMAAADVLFMSHEHLPASPEDWLGQVRARYGTTVSVVGMGSDGALLGLSDGSITHVPAVTTRPIVNTIGAGDALFSAFVSDYAQSGDPQAALRRAVVFASWKIGVRGGADGFVDTATLDSLCREVYE